MCRSVVGKGSGEGERVPESAATEEEETGAGFVCLFVILQTFHMSRQDKTFQEWLHRMFFTQGYM